MSNLKDQVLSIKQVQELIELGFDVSKYASMCWLKEPNGDKLLITTLDESCYEAACMNPVPTLTIGDIIEILPIKIVKDRRYYSFAHLICDNEHVIVYAYSIFDNSVLFDYINKDFKYCLFETLKWCIKEKHITI